MNGIWLPLITPFYNNEIDYDSIENLIEHYINEGITGIIITGTTGEAPVINNYEFEKILDKSSSLINKRVPLFAGTGGSYTDEVIRKIKVVEKYQLNGVLTVTPYYNKPDQNGLYAHFKKISENTDLNILLYNNPSRTGINMTNETVFKLSEYKNIIGIKDCSGNINQTTELILYKNKNFSVLCGEDLLFYPALTLGADGGILASAHINTKSFIELQRLISINNTTDALYIWKNIYNTVKILFEEPNPAPIKYILKKKGLINSSETRLPITEITEKLKIKINETI